MQGVLGGEGSARGGEGTRRLLAVVAMAASFLFIGFYFYSHPELIALVGNVGVGDLLALLVGQALFLVLQGLRYHVVFRVFAGAPIPVPAWLRIFIVAQAINFVAPQAGNLYRALTLRAAYGVSLARYVGGYAFFIWANLIAGFVLGAALLAVIDPGFAVQGVPLALASGLAALALGVAPLAARASGGLRRVPVRWLARVGEKLRAGTQAASRTLRDGRFWSRYPILTLATFTTSLTMTWVCFMALDSRITLGGVLFLYLTTSLLAYLPLAPANLGVHEIVYGAGSALLGMTVADGLWAAALVRASGAVTLFMLAVPLGATRAFREVRQAGRPTEAGGQRG